MITFITSLRHPANVKSMDTTMRLLERTLRSVCAQTNPNFSVVVVCHQIPDIKFSHSKIEYLLVDLPAPAKTENLEKRRDIIRLDRGRKYLAALYHIQNRSPSHVMFFDADDCVSNLIADVVLKAPADISWYINQGYIYKENSSFIFKKSKDFHKLCGTCFIFSYSIFKLPANISQVSEEWVKKNLGSHVLVYEFLAKKNVALQPLPLIGAVYIIGTGENYSRTNNILEHIRGNRIRCLIKKIIALFQYRVLTSAIRKRFSLFAI